jgi:ribosomal protein L11
MKKSENLVLKKFSMFLRAASIEVGPPLSTILGNYGANTTNFCKEFNEVTKELPNYFLIEAHITINVDKSVVFSVKEPSITLLLKLITIDTETYYKGQGGFKINVVKGLNLRDIYLISRFKFGFYNKNTLKIICGIIKSLDFYIIVD